jgi:hypothetical protein
MQTRRPPGQKSQHAAPGASGNENKDKAHATALSPKAPGDRKEAGPTGHKGRVTRMEQETARVAEGETAWKEGDVEG